MGFRETEQWRASARISLDGWSALPANLCPFQLDLPKWLRDITDLIVHSVKDANQAICQRTGSRFFTTISELCQTTTNCQSWGAEEIERKEKASKLRATHALTVVNGLDISF
jgi:hypothetical protein